MLRQLGIKATEQITINLRFHSPSRVQRPLWQSQPRFPELALIFLPQQHSLSVGRLSGVARLTRGVQATPHGLKSKYRSGWEKSEVES